MKKYENISVYESISVYEFSEFRHLLLFDNELILTFHVIII